MATAKRMFLERGYEKTTLEQICNEVDVNVTTFFKHFNSKEELVFARMLDALELLQRGLEAKPADIPVMEYWWDFLAKLDLPQREQEAATITSFHEIPALYARYVDILRKYNDVLAAALARDAGKDPRSDLYSHLQAAIMLSVHVTTQRWEREVYGEQAELTDLAPLTRKIINTFPSRRELAPELRRRALGRKITAGKS